jgi:hypothetical protein
MHNTNDGLLWHLLTIFHVDGMNMELAYFEHTRKLETNAHMPFLPQRQYITLQ